MAAMMFGVRLGMAGGLAGALLSAVMAAAALTAPTPVLAQGLAAGKICMVVRSCNFSKRAAVRGCLSSYSCRQCDFRRRLVRRADGRVEYRSSCSWGAGS